MVQKKNFKHCQFSANNFGINGFLVGNKKKSKERKNYAAANIT